jgi:alpha-glucoside transport system permease protein
MSQHTSPGSEDSGSTVLSPPPPETTGAKGRPPGSSPSNRSTYVGIGIGLGIVLVGTWLFDNVLKTNKGWEDFVDDSLSEWFQTVFKPDNAAGKIALMVVMTLVFMGVVGLLLLLVGHAPKRGQEKWQIAIFLVPSLLLLFYALFLPSIQTIVQSFQDKRGDFIGLENYQWMFTQPDIIVVIQNTFAWVLIVPISSVVIGLLYAIAVDGAKTERLAKTLVFLPLAISFVGASIIWKFVYDYRTAEVPQIGLANQILVWLGQDTYQFIQNPRWNTFFLMVILIWIQAGFAMVILSAAIKGIPTEIVEAARLDGVNPRQMFFKVTLPSIRPAVVVVFSTITVLSLKVFDIVRTTTGGQFKTSVVANEMYTQSFQFGEKGRGAALAVFLFVLVVPIVWYQVRNLRHRQEVG